MTVLEERLETETKSVHNSALRVEERDELPQEDRPEIRIGFAGESELCVERTDITFQDVAGDKVRIRVTVHNQSAQISRPTTARLQSAPLGAFLPWTPLTVLPVKALQPGESLELVTEAVRPHPTPLGSFDRVPPKKLLAALNSPDPESFPNQKPSPDAGFERALTDWIIKRRSQWRKGSFTRQTPLPPDIMELLGRQNQHWAGNIEVFVRSRSVERHFSHSSRIYPGRTNLANFVVGSPGRLDAYAFELTGLRPDWEAKLFDQTNRQSLIVGRSDAPIEELRWVESRGGLMMILGVHPPANCQEGNVEVHVTQKSSGKSAIVEFNLNPTAKGLGCYAV